MLMPPSWEHGKHPIEFGQTLEASNLRIAVITHAIDRFDREGYVLNTLIEYWKDEGITAEVIRGPVNSPPSADLAISHVDMTAVTDEYARMFPNYPLVINGAVLDISKTTFSRQIIERNDPWQGPVIVKTAMNFGGMRELQERRRNGDSMAALGVQRPWRKVEALPSYPIFEVSDLVPPGVWRNPNLVVERFRPEQHESGEYALRQWVFLGDRGVCYQSFAREPIVKGKNTIRRIVLDDKDVPQSLHEFREQLGFDYGKFDFGIADGEAILYDVNRTPGRPRSGTQSEKVTQHYPSLAKGLNYFLRRLNA